MAVLREVPVSWANVFEPNTMYEPTWEIQVTLTKEQAAALQEEAKAINKKGIKIKEENGEFFFRFKRKVMKSDGTTQNSPPLVCGPGGKSDVFTALIGNGSICNIQYNLVGYDNKFGKGITTDLKGIQVISHVPYGVQDGDEFDSAPKSSNKDDTFDDEDFN